MTPRLLPRSRHIILLTSVLLLTPAVMAELIVAPQGGSKPSGASVQRAKAASYQNELPVASDDDGDGLLSPRGGAPAEERAYDNRVRAKAYQQLGEPLPPPIPATVSANDGQPRATGQRSRARAFAGNGNGQDIDLSHVGRDGIPLVTCHDVDNVSGRIGDDTLAGSLIFIVRNGQQIKVRCK